MGFWVWGLGVGSLGFGPNPKTPNPQSPIPNPQREFIFPNNIYLIKYSINN